MPGAKAGGGLPTKVEHKPPKQTRRLQWSKLPNRRVDKDSFWAHSEEEKLYSDKMMQEIVTSFGLIGKSIIYIYSLIVLRNNKFTR